MKKIMIILSMFLLNIDAFAAVRLPPDNLQKKICIDREVIAKNISTGEIKTFTSTCDIQNGWIEVGRSGYFENSTGEKQAFIKDKSEYENTIVNFNNIDNIELIFPKSISSKRNIFIFSKTYDFDLLDESGDIQNPKKIYKRKGFSIIPLSNKVGGNLLLGLGSDYNKNGKIYIYIKDGTTKSLYKINTGELNNSIEKKTGIIKYNLK